VIVVVADELSVAINASSNSLAAVVDTAVAMVVAFVERALDTAASMVIPAGAGEMVTVNVADPGPAPFVALSVTVNVPAAVGVPEIRPVPLFTDSPAVNPVAPKLVGAFVAVIWYANAAPTVPPAVVALVITGGTGTIDRVNVAVPDPPPLVALRVTVVVPATVGVPEITPLPLFTASPAGSPVAPKLVGVFVAVI
jgi:hypothetical protein